MTVTKKHYSKCSVFAFGFETCIKTILPLISRLTVKICWLLTTFQSDAASAHWRPSLFLINMFLCDGFSLSPGALVWFLGVKVNGAYYYDVLLLKQLLPDICQAAGDFCFPVHHACAKALSCCDTRIRTSHQTWPPNRPDLSSVDYKSFRNAFIRNNKGCQDRWWAVVIKRMTFY